MPENLLLATYCLACFVFRIVTHHWNSLLGKCGVMLLVTNILLPAQVDQRLTDRQENPLLQPDTAADGRDFAASLIKPKADPTPLAVLLNHGATPPEGNWDTLLWHAFQRRDLAQARLLLAHGANPAQRGSHGQLLVEAAVLANEHDFVKLLLDYGSPAGNAIYLASASGNHHLVSLMLSCGVSPDITIVPSRDTALATGIRNHHDLVAELLVRNGANPNLSLPEGQSAFHLAVATGCPRTVDQLLAAGTKPNSPFTFPAAPAFFRHVRPGVMRWILKNDHNVTPLMLAADAGDIPTARRLIKAGAKLDVHTRASHFWPINFACLRHNVPMTRLLLGQDPYHEERHLELRLSEQRVCMHDAQGTEIFTSKVSTGRQGFATPTGEFVITDKYTTWTSTLYHAQMPYFMRLNSGDFGLHQGYVPDHPASHGCIRVPVPNATKLFSLVKKGDRVSILP